MRGPHFEKRVLFSTLHVFLIYRAGWNISLGTLVCNISLAIAMLIIGGTAFNELVTGLQIVSVAVCAVGLVLISYMEIRIKTGDEEKIKEQY